MTLDDLVECPASKLEALSDKELEAILLPYFPKTRPDMVPRYTEAKKPARVLTLEEQTKLAKRKRTEQMLAQFNIKLNI